MNYLRLASTLVLMAMSSASFAATASNPSEWANRVQWRFKIALERTEPSLVQQRTKASVTLEVAPNGQIGDVNVSAVPASPQLEQWIKMKLKSVGSVEPVPGNKTTKVVFDVKYAGHETSNWPF